MNRFECIGNLIKDAEIRTTGDKEVETFSIGIRRTHKNKEGNYDSDFFNFIIWQPLEFYKNNLKKGTKVTIKIKIPPFLWKNGRILTINCFNVRPVIMCGVQVVIWRGIFYFSHLSHTLLSHHLTISIFHNFLFSNFRKIRS